MAFIGILSDCKSFDNIREYLKSKEELNINLIHINRKSIENIKNIKFETIIIDSDIEKYEEEIETLEQLCKKAKYLLINTDINLGYSLESEKIITYGMNRKATVTVSSISDSGILIYLQNEVNNIKGKTIEVSEKLFKISEKNRLKNYEVLIIYLINLIYKVPLITEKKEKSNKFEEN